MVEASDSGAAMFTSPISMCFSYIADHTDTLFRYSVATGQMERFNDSEFDLKNHKTIQARGNFYTLSSRPNERVEVWMYVGAVNKR